MGGQEADAINSFDSKYLCMVAGSVESFERGPFTTTA